MDTAEHKKKSIAFHLTWFFVLLWVVFFPAKGCVYQIVLYLTPLFIVSMRENRQAFFKFLTDYGWVIFVCLVAPVILSDFSNLLSGKPFLGDFGLAFKMLWRIIIFPISVSVFLLSSSFPVKKIVLILTSIFSLHAVAGLVELFFNIPYIKSLTWSGRMDGFVFNPNPFGLLMAFAFLIAFYGMMQASRKREAFFYVVAITLFLICCLYSYSRGSFIALLVGIVAFTLTNRKKTIQIGATLGIISLFVFLIKYYHFINLHRFSNFFESKERLLLLQEYFRVILDKIIVGYGSIPISLVGPDSPVTAVGPHNILVETAYRTGLMGLICLLIFIVYAAKASLYCRSVALVVALSACFLTSGLFDHSLYSSIIYQSFFSIILILFLVSCPRGLAFEPGTDSHS